VEPEPQIYGIDQSRVRKNTMIFHKGVLRERSEVNEQSSNVAVIFVYLPYSEVQRLKTNEGAGYSTLNEESKILRVRQQYK
jgi:hypothetical protein